VAPDCVTPARTLHPAADVCVTVVSDPATFQAVALIAVICDRTDHVVAEVLAGTVARTAHADALDFVTGCRTAQVVPLLKVTAARTAYDVADDLVTACATAHPIAEVFATCARTAHEVAKVAVTEVRAPTFHSVPDVAVT
jgi:hypothetical protein